MNDKSFSPIDETSDFDRAVSQTSEVFGLGLLALWGGIRDDAAVIVEKTSYTISQDLADGKLAQKDRDLRLLLKAPASSPSTTTRPSQTASYVQSSGWTTNPAWNPPSTGEDAASKTNFTHFGSPAVMEPPSQPHSHAAKKRRRERSRTNAAYAPDQSRHEKVFDLFDKVSTSPLTTFFSGY
ncbi:uncharacterized protein Z519_04537 [Cladophialophora bantiana CBS 173.52]|uniref:Uncharacterized protein n=1 Tax=Cladophialophora bantiana (strain ATCC 10958 / CBS 173.52 / CDC B-1940 / NIH 8579) TaxID=1442370 RepID=A0A0D2EXD8_CLAB1|nr:uncharacterized protein Z519_04537 [Cladophialophora bantiana CBS 173.52]KIW94561.1 hypothetical protein Z519_04537 [Cladophialophora bantiana CBS 173.52]